jgi:glycosidase
MSAMSPRRLERPPGAAVPGARSMLTMGTLVGTVLVAPLAGWLAGCAHPGAQAVPDTSPVPKRETGSPLAEGWQHGAFIEIFVRAYADSDGDGIGDLRGLTSRLEHLQRLGIRGIWLMPITANGDGDHGYATTDFRAVAPEYGTLADFDELIAQAHARGIGVVMDYVINHAAAAHPMFVAARQGPGSAFRDWFVWSDKAPTGWDIWGQNPWYHTPSQPWLHTGDLKQLPPPAPGARDFYFATFGPQMPDFNFRNPEVVNYHVDSLRFWLNRGLDGYRLDAVPHLIENNARDWNNQPESRVLTQQIQALVKGYTRRYTVCEATAEPRDYARAELCGAAFAFGLENQLAKAARGDAEAIAKVAAYPAGAPPTMGVFVSNHDKFAGRRMWDQVGGDERVYRLTAATYLLLPGTPFIYYGEEIGQAGAAGLIDDPQIRGPMSWTADAATAGFTRGQPFRALAANRATHNVAAQQADPHSLLAHYRALLALRHAWPSITRGSYERPVADGATLSFQRRLGDEHTVLTYNYGQAAARLSVAGLPAGARLQALQPGSAAALTIDATGVAQVPLAPQSFAVWQVRAR